MCVREEQITVYLSKKEKEKVSEKAEEQGVSNSTYLRLKGLGKI